MVNGEVYGPQFDPVFKKHGIREMIYTSSEGEEKLFPDYFALPGVKAASPGRSNRRGAWQIRFRRSPMTPLDVTPI